jgi:hypothetical protein
LIRNASAKAVKIQRCVDAPRCACARSEIVKVIVPPSADSTAVATAPASISSEPTSV